MDIRSAELVPSAPSVTAIEARTATDSLPTFRVNIMRVGYLMMVVGLALTRWTRLPEAASMPLYEGAVTALLTALSLLALVGLRYPVRMLPILVFESAWKLIWLGVVALPHLIAGDMEPDMSTLLFSVSLVVVILAVTPWDYVWKQYVRAPGDRWR